MLFVSFDSLLVAFTYLIVSINFSLWFFFIYLFYFNVTMNCEEIERVLYNSDSDSELDNNYADPDWNDINGSENSEVSENESGEDTNETGDIWTDYVHNVNDNIMFSQNNSPVGINPDIIETMSFGSLYTFFTLFLMKK